MLGAWSIQGALFGDVVGCRPMPQPLGDLITLPPNAWAISWWPKQTPTSAAWPLAARRKSRARPIQGSGS